MKFDMNGSEFAQFSASLALAEVARVTNVAAEREVGLQQRIDVLRDERNDAWEQRDQARSDLDDLRSSTRYLRNERDEAERALSLAREEIRKIRSEVAALTLTLPNRKENGLSVAFELYHSGNKIMAIKQIREIFSLDLRSAKDLVEGNYNDHNHPELVGFSKGFKHVPYNNLTGDLDEAVSFLAPHLSKTIDQIKSILLGTFHKGETTSKPVDPCASVAAE